MTCLGNNLKVQILSTGCTKLSASRDKAEFKLSAGRDKTEFKLSAGRDKAEVS